MGSAAAARPGRGWHRRCRLSRPKQPRFLCNPAVPRGWGRGWRDAVGDRALQENRMLKTLKSTSNFHSLSHNFHHFNYIKGR